MTDLVERLLANIDQPLIYRDDAALREAATALEAKDKELVALRASYDKAIGCRLEWRHRAETAERERDEAREALKQIIARTYSSDRRCRLDCKPVAEICDIAARAITGEKP